MGSSWLIVLVALPWLAAIGSAVLPGRRASLARPLALVASGGMALILAWLGPSAMADQGLTSHTAWVPGLGVELALRLDALSFTLMVNLTLVALAASWYAWGYWAETERSQLAYALMLAFVGGMLGTLLSDDMVLFFVFWESMLISSSLLLAGWGSGPNLGQITLKYVLFTQAGSLCILVVLARVAIGAGSSSMDVVRAWLAALPQAELRWMEILLLIGFGVKLAIVPLHLWLPDAHSVAPMPITILLAATMLSMGAYGIARFPMEILGLAAVRALQLPLLILGLVCAFYGALMCFAARDIKRLVAYSSVSQMGYVLFGLAELTPRGVQGALMHLVNHGIIKALLFMGVGLIMHATGRR
ncbi:MAG: hypothetical protein JXA74_09685, partial [Anaerolineae bacterium]|nr:hypothetical protein [Anaerolineae bacterium]